MKTIHVTNIRRIADKLQKLGIRYERKITNLTDTITVLPNQQNHEPAKYAEIPNGMNIHELGFLSKVKSDIKNRLKDSDLPQTHINLSEIDNYKGEPIPGTYKNMIEVDIKKSYWNIAFNEGIISEDIYKEGLTVSKDCRLCALGALACGKHMYFFDGIKEHYIETVRGEFANVFFYICKRQGEIMSSVLENLPPSNSFFWFDAIFTAERNKNKVVKLFENNDLPAETYPVKTLRVYEGQITPPKPNSKWAKYGNVANGSCRKRCIIISIEAEFSNLTNIRFRKYEITTKLK